jgi:Uma2 family endonuclease
MAQSALDHAFISIDDYLELEAESQLRHEYVRGALYAQAGGTFRHTKLTGNIFGHLWNAAGDGPCDVVSESLKLRVANDVIYYPDVMVHCDRSDADPIVKTRPCVVIEVLSRSTIRIDRGEKLFAYRGLASLQAYLMFHQNEQRVERHYRDAAGAWQSVTLDGDAVVPIPCLDIELSLADLYRNLPPVSDT